MKKICAAVLSFVLLFFCISPVQAVESYAENQTVYQTERILDNGIRVVSVITIPNVQTWSSTRTAAHQEKYYDGDTLIADIVITGTFRYTGTSVSVVSKELTKAATYDGWSFKQSSFTSSGGTITLTGKLTKLLIFNANVNMSLTCDKNGNIS